MMHVFEYALMEAACSDRTPPDRRSYPTGLRAALRDALKRGIRNRRPDRDDDNPLPLYVVPPLL